MSKMQKQIYGSLKHFNWERHCIKLCAVMKDFIWARMLKKLKISFMVTHSKHIKGCRRKVNI